jgi:hypothetical protein
VDDLLLLFQPDGPLFTGRVLYNDAKSGERGALTLSTFEKVSFSLVFARLAAEVSVFVEKEEKIGVTVRRTDLNQPAVRLDEETIFLLHADPVAVIRSLRPAPSKIFVRRADPALLSPLRIGFDALAATFGDEVFIRRRGDQVECPCCGLWANIGVSTPDPRLTASLCRSMACGAKLPITLRSDRWASIETSSLLANPDRERFFFPREWNTHGPWITREDLEMKHRDWTTIKKEFVA